MVNAYAQVGENAIINSQALVEHDCTLAHHSHVSTGAKINGEVHIGERCLIGSNTVVKQGVSITDNTIICAGSGVLESIHTAGVYMGVIK
jgi:UDP-3-O-[3-hydroxymyristoyl] glucosamine N-acyltransferase